MVKEISLCEIILLKNTYLLIFIYFDVWREIGSF